MRNTRELTVAVLLALLALALGAAWAIAAGSGEDSSGATETAPPAAESSAEPTEESEPSVQDDEHEENTALDSKRIDELKSKLSAEQNNVCFLKGTEPPFSGKYYDHHEPGGYACVVCEQPLFESDTKFDSGTGWPSFWDMALPGAVDKHDDLSHGMVRTEVTCANCGSHLGHVFDDGPKPTGQRYCINSLSLDFLASEKWDERVVSWKRRDKDDNENRPEDTQMTREGR